MTFDERFAAVRPHKRQVISSSLNSTHLSVLRSTPLPSRLYRTEPLTRFTMVLLSATSVLCRLTDLKRKQ